MSATVVADTTVLIDLWRYSRSPHRLSGLHTAVGTASLIVPWITEAEFSRGAIHNGVAPEVLNRFYERFLRMPLGQTTMNTYCRIWSIMAGMGKAPDYPDLWIAACALVKCAPLVTRNPRHFNGIPDLEVVSYAIAPR